MPKVAKGRRKRAYRPKTRSGCLTCRIRRVKCDETRPACLRCTSTRRVCDGYCDAQALLASRSNSVPVIAGPSFDIQASPQSKRSFAFFVQWTSPQLAGFFGSEFWERLVLQAAYHESAVRHAIVAIGSLHELSEHQTVTIDANKAFALEQYNLAIRDLLAPMSQNREQGIDVCLISCILFTCFENMQGHHASAMSHIQSGAKLLLEILFNHWNEVRQPKTLGSKWYMSFYAPIEVLARIFARVDSQVRTMIGAYNFKIYEISLSDTTYNDIPLSFSSIEEAKNIFEYGHCLFTSSLAAQQSCDPVHFPTDIEVHKGHFETLLSGFSLALQVFVDSKSSSFTPKEEIAIAILQLHVLSNYVLLHIEQPPSNGSSWDTFMPQFKEMIILAEKIVSSTSPGNDRGGQTTSFCSDMGFIIPLYNMIKQCRDPMIRRKAIALLRLTSRQEGLWNSLLIAKAAERIMEIEESELEETKACSDGPDWTRSSSIQPTLELDERGGRLQYIRQGQGANAQIAVVEEIFSW